MLVALFAAAIPLMTDFKTARFVGIDPPIVFQPNAVTTVELTPVDPGMAWDQAVVSWNVQPADGARLTVEARVTYPGHETKWYTLANWALTGYRASVDGQKDADGTVNTDTLSMVQSGGLLQLRLTGQSTNVSSKLTLLGISFCDTSAPRDDEPPNALAWGKTLAVPHRFQDDYPGGGGLCSPTTVSMLLWHWAQVLNRPEMNEDVPVVQAAVWDPIYKGAGNWPFNMAFAGSYLGMAAYAARLGGLRDLEDWIVAGIPVACSVSYQLLQGKTLNRATEQGHLVVLVGFTAQGDPVFNDPASRETPKTYKRADFESAWDYSHRTAYLVYPTSAAVPTSAADRWLPRKTQEIAK